jgi:hypothetical protein
MVHAQPFPGLHPGYQSDAKRHPPLEIWITDRCPVEPSTWEAARDARREQLERVDDTIVGLRHVHPTKRCWQED